MVSTSTSICEYFDEKYPYIEITNIELRNLEVYYENSLSLKLYLMFQIGSHTFKTRANSDRNNYFWGNGFEIYCPGFEPLVITLMDRDEFGGDIAIAGVSLPAVIFKMIPQRTKWEIKLAVDNDQILDFTSDMENTDQHYKLPVLSVNLAYYGLETLQKFEANIEKTNTVDGENGKYTEYFLKIVRKDGFSWEKKFRYSEIRDLRNKMVKFFPELKKLKFPGKNYFSWLIRNHSKVQENLINERKKEFQDFLSYILEKGYQEKSSELKNFIFSSSSTDSLNFD